MSGNVWMFSHMIDDEDLKILQKDFITYYEGADYYGLVTFGEAYGIIIAIVGSFA